MIHRILITLLASLYALSSFSYYVKQIDGINYLLFDEDMTAIAEGLGSQFDGYTGNLTIPSTVFTTYEENNKVYYKYYTVRTVAYMNPHNGVSVVNITSVSIPNTVTTIGTNAFEGFTGLTSITIPNSVTKIEQEAFKNCTNLTSITIPNSVTSIGDWAFGYCYSLTSITLPDSLKTIGTYVFYNCTNLKEITIPNSVTSIGVNAFYQCTNLKEITIPNSVTSIGSGAFRYTNLRTVTIGESVESIGAYAFLVSSINNIFVLRSTPPSAGSFSSNEYSATLHVPIGTRDVYSQTTPWSDFNFIVDDLPNPDTETKKTETVTTRTTAGNPMSFDEFKALAGTGKHFAIVASSEHSLVYPKWFSFSSDGYPTTLSSAQLFDLENSETGEGWYNIKRVSDNLYVSTEGGNFDADTKMDFKLVNRLAGDYWSEFSDASLHISFDNAEGNHYNANTTNLGFRSGTGGYSTYVAYGPFCLVEVNYLDKNNNPLRASESYIVAEGTSFEAPVIMGKAVRGENVVAVSKDQTINFIYDDATFDYKVIVNGAVEGMNVSIKGDALTYGQTDYSNAEAVSESDVVVNFTEGAEFLSYRVSINGIYIVIDCEDSRWPVNFHKWQTFTRTDRHINSVTFNDQTVDGLYTDYRTTCYQDFTATKTVTLPAATSIKPSFDVLGQWMHGFVYIDLNNDGDFSDEGELVSYVNENNPNLATDLPEFISPATAGAYRMRVKMDWESLDPGGNTGEDPEDVYSKNHIIKNGGAIIDLKLVVTSAVTSINPIRDAKSGVTYYNLQGQRQAKAQEGINIINGKKVLVK